MLYRPSEYHTPGNENNAKERHLFNVKNEQFKQVKRDRQAWNGAPHYYKNINSRQLS